MTRVRPASLRDVDAVVVLGKELRRDPARGLRELRARAAAATVALRLGVPWAVSLEAPLRGQVDAGSALVARLMDELGAPLDRLVRAEITRSTREEAVQTAWLARSRGWSSLVVVTAGYHQARAQRYFDAIEGVAAQVCVPDAVAAWARPVEARWIAEGHPDPRALAAEGRAERAFGLLGAALRPLPTPLRWRIEIAAGAALRGASSPRRHRSASAGTTGTGS